MICIFGECVQCTNTHIYTHVSNHIRAAFVCMSGSFAVSQCPMQWSKYLLLKWTFKRFTALTCTKRIMCASSSHVAGKANLLYTGQKDENSCRNRANSLLTPIQNIWGPMILFIYIILYMYDYDIYIYMMYILYINIYDIYNVWGLFCINPAATRSVQLQNLQLRIGISSICLVPTLQAE